MIRGYPEDITRVLNNINQENALRTHPRLLTIVHVPVYAIKMTNVNTYPDTFRMPVDLKIRYWCYPLTLRNLKYLNASNENKKTPRNRIE